ncbi:MAG: NAD-binding protein [Vulcanimicrobiaceae bacterium]
MDDRVTLVPARGTLVLIVGGDALALRVCEELTALDGQQVALLWHDAGEYAERVRRTGARFIGRRPHVDALREAGILEASAIVALTEDDRVNLQVGLRARDLNPRIRVVLRQYNRTLGRKVEQNVPNCSVISLSSHSAATYASAAVDATCFYGLQFPDIDGPLVGFSKRSARAARIAGLTAAQAERELGERVIAVDGAVAFDRDKPLREAAEVVLFKRIVRDPSARAASDAGTSAVRIGELARNLYRSVQRLDPIARALGIAGVLVFLIGAVAFSFALHLDLASAAYFVVETMTTTGYGDISVRRGGAFAEVAAVLLMLCGIVLNGLFVAVLASKLTQAQWVAMQGLRPIKRRGHVIVCGAGSVGSCVIDYLVALEEQVVVVDTKPEPSIVESAHDRHFDLLTGDAAKDRTLELCNVKQAKALIALTHSDTMNLEVALGARAQNQSLPIVMRVQEGAFAESVARHFGIDRTFGTAALAAPVFAGLSRFPGVRGRVLIGSEDYSIGEFERGDALDPALASCVPLAVWRHAKLALIASFAETLPHDRVLLLYPIWRLREPAGERAASQGRPASGEEVPSAV